MNALLISTENAEAVIGQSWRWCRDFARARGLTIHRAGAKPFIDAAELIAAIRAQEQQPDAPAPAEPLTPEDAAAQVRAIMGKRRRDAA